MSRPSAFHVILLLVTVFVLVLWTGVPAVGALLFGLWLRRTLGPDVV